MNRPRGAPGRRREVLVLALGLVSAALLAGAALAPFSDPELAGRAAFAELAGRVEDGVAAEWARMLAEPSLEGRVLGRWTAEAAARAAALPEEADPIDPEPGLNAHDVLLGEALRLEAAGSTREALTTVLEALGKQAPAARKGLSRLLAVRLARALDDCATAREQWLVAADELEGSETSGGVPTLVACALAAAPCLEGDALADAQARVVDAWIAGRIALGSGPMREVLAERVDDLVAASEAVEGLRSYEKAHALGGLAASLPHGRLPERPADSTWHLDRDVYVYRVIAWRAEGTDGVVACEVLPGDLAASLRARVDRSELVPTGFLLDFGLDGDVGGEAVREPRALAGDVLELTLRHEDPEAAMRAEGGRLALLRAALLVVAVLTAGAGLATFRALRRERRLAELKSAFVANVSHELRTPLASILMLAENLEAGRVADEPGRARYHALIRREAERLRRLVADVLDFSRLERGKGLELRREALEVGALAAGLREEALAWAQRAGFDLALDVQPAVGRVEVELDALRRCVVNLLENARKHSGEGGATLSLHVARGELVVAVEDAGRGVPEEARVRVFDPFTRLERDDGAAGTGLGLAIVREIARAHGGDVALRPGAGGRGARFELRLPLLQTAGEEVTA